MRRRGIAVVVVVLALASTSVAAKSGRRFADLRAALQRELGLTRASIELHESLAALDRERASLEYTAAVLDHAGRESMRRLQAYRDVQAPREARARARGRALYRLARGGLARLAFEPFGADEGQPAADRIARGRALRFLVRHDLRQLETHRRAEARARAELVAAARELQAMEAVTMLEAMTDHVLAAASREVDPEVPVVHRDRQRIGTRAAPAELRRNRALLALVEADRRELRGLRGIDGGVRLVRPVPGRVVGRFGEHEDPVLKIPVVRNGVELSARPGTEVRAMAAGRVVHVSHLPGLDEVVVVDHGGGQYTLTARLFRLAVAEGDEVKAGGVLGRVAPKTVDDGLGPTVYVELRHGEKPVDPEPQLARARRVQRTPTR